MALGAAPKRVLRAAVGRAFPLLSIGSFAGLVLGLLATKVLSYIVYQATPKDPFVLIGVLLTMLALGLVATWIPAQRALAVNPMILMREESLRDCYHAKADLRKPSSQLLIIQPVR